jgi:phytanoyl-CoA hydroxylase
MNNLNLSKLKSQYEYNGWVKVGNFFSKKNVANLNKKINVFLSQRLKRYKGKNINFLNDSNKGNGVNEINSFHKLADSKYIRQKSKNKNLLNIVNALLNSKPRFIQSELFAKPAKKGLPSPCHQDNYYWCIKGGNALTVWVALDNVSKKNGGLYYYNKSHKDGLVNHVPSYAKGSSQTVSSKINLKKYKKITPKLNSGDALFHHSLIIHGSQANTSGKRRRGLTFQFKPYNSKIDLLKKNKYLNNLKLQLQTRL